MIKSMTGYGRAESVAGDEKIVAEVRSNNHRYCDTSLRIPPKCYPFESEIKKLVLSKVTRGRVELSLQFERDSREDLIFELDVPLAEQYYLLLKKLQEHFKLTEEVSLAHILMQKDVLVAQAASNSKKYEWEKIERPIASALGELVKMRETEGALLREDILSRARNMEGFLDQITAISESSTQEYQESLRVKIQDMCRDIEIDRSRLAQEVAYLVERSDITEELVRARSHLAQLRDWLDSRDAVGRRLDFIIQEIHREVNTIGSKSCNAEISLHVVEIKNELEKIREQVQNIE
jgi:uncharacterized protein (TIGR00255 family)